MKEIIRYLKEKYAPYTVIVYGSYADGTNRDNSDFDALVILKSGEQAHDVSFVGKTQLDVFVYPLAYFNAEFDPEPFVQICDGIIVWDTENYGLRLKEKIASYIDSLPCKTEAEIEEELAWLQKMLLRTQRRDAEGMFRGHWLLVDSLSIFCDIQRHPYQGPKKSLAWMEKEYPEAFSCYSDALFSFHSEALERWVECLALCASHPRTKRP